MKICTQISQPIVFLFLFVALAAFVACDDPKPSSASGRSIAPRDTSINKNNAANASFLDSVDMEKFIADQPMSDTVADGMRSFYNARNFQFAWIGTEGLTEQALLFKSLYDFGNDSGAARKSLDDAFDNLAVATTISPASYLKTELMLTWRFVNYVDALHDNQTEQDRILVSFTPARKMSVLDRANLIIDQDDSGVKNDQFAKLKEQLKKYLANVSGGEQPLLDSIKLILINLERMRWAPDYSAGKSIQVNIPEFVLHTHGEGDNLNMPVVVGKEGSSTIMFAGTLNQVVFSPYWNIPRSIVKNEIVPAMEKNKNYLKEKQMEITGESNGLPVVRQLPGVKNALGKVKFLFPNSFNIYLHDTPEKSLFDKEQRAYSHGCIRVADPLALSEFILKDMSEWTPEKMTTAMNSGTEQYVKVKAPVQVLISYYTTWVDDSGNLQFREDIYNHDSKAAKQLFL